MLWIDEEAMAHSFLAQWGPVHAEMHAASTDEISQRAAVVEAGLRAQTMLTGDVTTPLATAVRALRQLNSAVVYAKHQSLYGTRPASKGAALARYGFAWTKGPSQWPSVSAEAEAALKQTTDVWNKLGGDLVEKPTKRQLKAQISDASTAAE